jgi:hypothetical protein
VAPHRSHPWENRSGDNRRLWKETFMWDLGLLAATAAFFFIALAYTAGCQRLGSSEEKQR